MQTHTQHYVLLTGLLFLTLAAVPWSARLSAGLLPENKTDSLEQERAAMLKKLSEAQQSVTESHGASPDAQAQRQAGMKALQAADQTIGQIMKQKRVVRLQWATQRDLAAYIQKHYAVDATVEWSRSQAELAYRSLFGTAVLRLAHHVGQQVDQPLLFQLLTASFAHQLQARFAYRALAQFNALAVHDLIAVRTVPSALASLQAEYQALQTSYHAAQTDYDQANRQVALSDATLQEIKRIVAAVEGKIRQMQQSLADYDERIRLAAEKELVAKGLRAPREEGYKAPIFQWPVVGEITAGYYEASYQRYFGVPHKAIDIRQPQGSAVRAAAMGIVYYVQYGGARGYSYILIGHRGGYATLYGHLSAIYVAAGDEVKQGTTIGLSGGIPGTVGAGPMTTGAHLHFEVIKEGTHINPTSVLP